MINWYDRIGNRIEMKLYENADRPEFEWVKGNVIEGYRYRDGIVHMISDDGRIIWCGVESGDFRKSEDSLGDFISKADHIRAMSDAELAELFVYWDCDGADYSTNLPINGCKWGSKEEILSRVIDYLQSEVE